ncbi:hypothetical protein SDRG_06424 [Saprolegnia diclina VS20]|uniref:PFU domain-containing protein n=1 Tax=Saprolegnia diclina (strain VS20) TaxID=1156394 RepID=T0QEH8_SAPDV|nr:hypothetical protein SDRG_06424 [Saprolegnia diclina VS20]EQC36319.1 hypothetical protein SDRG_06424 [Saprolegnia diclina VS20]|eukprot:XP_008610425.1 hypothetical protein SDRG_06424 [Saprolegnia diclina VS20]
MLQLVALFCLAAIGAAQDVLVSLPVTVNGATKNLELHRGQTVESAAVSFMELHGLIDNGLESENSQKVVQYLASQLREKAPKDEVFITMPLTIDGSVADLVLYKNEAPVDAVSRFLRDSALSEDAKTQAHPQILDLLTERVRDEATPAPSQPAAQFVLDLTIDGQATAIAHYAGQDPLVEARAFLAGLGVTDEGYMQNVMPQIAQMLQSRIDELASPKELFSLPVTLNDQAMLLVHYDNTEPSQSATAFLQKNGLTDTATVNALLPQLVQMITNQLTQQAGSVQAESASPTREPLFSLPITLGSMEQPCNYFEGDSPELTAQLFLETHGLAASAEYASLLSQLTSLLQERINAINGERSAAATATTERALTIPINVGGTDVPLSFYPNQDPAVVAAAFCEAQLRAASADDMQACKVVLYQTITGVLDRLEAEAMAQTTPPSTERKLLVTLDIDLGEGKSAILLYYAGESTDATVRAFCDANAIDTENIPFLLDELQKQIDALQ